MNKTSQKRLRSAEFLTLRFGEMILIFKLSVDQNQHQKNQIFFNEPIGIGSSSGFLLL